MIRRVWKLVLCTLLLAAFTPLEASAWKGWSYNYCMDWSVSPFNCYDLFPAAVEAQRYQATMGYEYRSYNTAWASDVIAKFDNVGLIYLVSHGSPGSIVFYNTGRATNVSCLRSTAIATSHGHAIKDTRQNCNHQRALRDRTVPSPTRLVMFQACQTALPRTTSDRGLLWASYYAGVTHSAGFEGNIVIASNMPRDFSYGYWKSLKDGNHTVQAMDDGVWRVRWLHLGWAGSYDTHRYWGSNIRVD